MGLLTSLYSIFCILEKECEKGLEGNFQTFAWIQELLKLLQFLNLLDWTAIAFLSRDVVKIYFSFIPMNLLNWTNLYICAVVHVFYTRHVWIPKWLCMTGGCGSLPQCWQTYPSQHTFPLQWSSKLLEKWDWKETRQSGWTMSTLLCVARSPRPWWLWIPAFCKSVCKHVAHKHCV